ncbi:MAG TPA: hypothetical protein VFP06_22705 [Acidimicrobiales bacterium]|nr:hypothetical protein [Acidimicrobiales bacterium]
MTPRRLDPDVVGRRLRLLRDTLGDLEPLRGVPPERFAREPGFAEYVTQVAAFLRSRVTGARPTDAAG